MEEETIACRLNVLYLLIDISCLPFPVGADGISILVLVFLSVVKETHSLPGLFNRPTIMWKSGLIDD